ncbi:MAG: DUF167 domain-containing protein [Actinobacteria bacterium]|nr:MAG: DUF167 domain-containing protein [Actinomycetota bacterium]
MEHARIPVRLIARARVNEIAGEREGALLVRVTAPPVDGRANAALREMIAKHLGIAAGRVSVVHGLTSRQKVVQVEGLSARELARALAKREA